MKSAMRHSAGKIPKVRGLSDSRKRSESSKRWLLRQLNDPYVVRAKECGYRSRAAFKLLEIDDKFHIFRPGQAIVDLGCAPGGWLQVAQQRVPRGRFIGVDLQDVSPMEGISFLKGDFTEESTVTALYSLLGDHRVDVVLSDMAAPACGIPKVDYIRIVALVQAASAFAQHVLSPGGVFVAKVLRGGTPTELLAELKRQFQTVSHMKPPASRRDSSEIYIVARGFRGREDGEI